MPNKWELTVEDPYREDGKPAVSVHASVDDVLSHIRETCDPAGKCADEGIGSLQNYLPLEGFGSTTAKSRAKHHR